MMQRFDVLVVGAGPAGSATAMHLARAGKSVLLADRARFPRDKPCGGGLTGRALKQAPCDVTPVVERVVDTFELRLHYKRSFRRTSSEPLILMTQRRRLDAYLAEQAAAAGATFRDGTRVDDSSPALFLHIAAQYVRLGDMVAAEKAVTRWEALKQGGIARARQASADDIKTASSRKLCPMPT